MTQKFEREIEEILRHMDSFVPEEPLGKRVSKRVGDSLSRLDEPLRNWRRYLTVQWLMVASISMVMLGFILRMINGTLAWYANTLGLVLFVAVILMAVFHFGQPNRPRVWRGQVIDMSGHSGWWQSMLRRWRLFRRSRGL